MSDQIPQNPIDRLDGIYSSSLPIRPQVVSNWGIDQPSRPRLPRRVLLTLMGCIVVLSVFSLVLMAIRPTPAGGADGADVAYQTLYAYAQARAAGVELDTSLTSEARIMLAGASRVETAAGPLIALRTGSTCWAVPVDPPLPAPVPARVLSVYCG